MGLAEREELRKGVDVEVAVETRIEQLYSIPRLAEMLGEHPQNLQKIFAGERRMGGTYYKFSPKSSAGRFRIPEREVNRFRAMRGLAPVNTPIEQKMLYAPKEIAEIVEFTKQRIYDLIRDGELESDEETWVAIPYLVLRDWFGSHRTRTMKHRAHRIPEAAEHLDVPVTELEKMVINGQLTANEHHRTIITREAFLKWLDKAKDEVVTITEGPKRRMAG